MQGEEHPWSINTTNVIILVCYLVRCSPISHNQMLQIRSPDRMEFWHFIESSNHLFFKGLKGQDTGQESKLLQTSFGISTSWPEFFLSPQCRMLRLTLCIRNMMASCSWTGLELFFITIIIITFIIILNLMTFSIPNILGSF